MNFLQSVVDAPMAHRLGWVLLHSIWQGALIGGVFELVRFILRRRSAHTRYLAGCLALALLLGAPILTFIASSPRPIAAADRNFTAGIVPPKVSPVSDSPAAFVPSVHHGSQFFMRQGLDFLGEIAPWLSAVWMVGVVFFSFKLTRSWWWVGRIRRKQTEPTEPALMERLNELRRRLGISRPVRLLKSALVEVPTVIGWLRPVILLPAASLTGLTPGQLEAVLAHELAHVRRFDYLVNAFQCLVETLMFYHPVVWWISRCVREERENCCDDLVVTVCGDRVGYARALAALEEFRGETPELAFAASGGSLLNRIRRLAGMADNGPATVRQAAGLALLAIGLALVGVGIFLQARPAMYRAIARIRINQDTQAQLQSNNGNVMLNFPDPKAVQTDLAVIQSSLLQPVAESLGLAEKWSKRFGSNPKLQVSDVVTLLRTRVVIQEIPDTSLVEIRVLDDDAAEAAAIANAIAEQYQRYRKGQTFEMISAKIGALKRSLDAQQAEVDEAQSNVDWLRTSLKITDTDPTSTMPTPTLSAETSRAIESQRIQSWANIAKFESILTELKSLSYDQVREAVATAVGPDQQLNDLVQQLNLAKDNVVTLKRDYAAESPKLQNAEQLVSDLENRIKDRVTGIMKGLQARVSSERAALASVETELERAKTNDLYNAAKTRPYYAAKQSLAEKQQFKSILAMKIASETTDMTVPRNSMVEIVESAVPPRQPVSQNRSRAIGSIGLGALLSLVGLVLLRSKPRPAAVPA